MRRFPIDCKFVVLVDLKRTYFKKNACYGGEAVPSTETVACHATVSVSSTTAAILGVVLSVTILSCLGGLGFLYYKNRRLYADYTQLKNSNIPMDDDFGEGSVSLE